MNKGRLWSFLALMIVLTAIGVYLYTNSHLLLSVGKIHISSLIYIIMIRVFFLVMNGVLLREFALKYRITLMPKEWFGLSVVTTMGNFITPFSGGLIARATYLKHKHTFSYSKFASLLAANYLIYLWVVCIVGLITLIISIEKPIDYWEIVLIFILVLMTISILIIIPSKKLPWNNSLAAVINESLDGWAFIKKDAVLLGKLILYTLCNIFLHGLSFWIALSAILGEPSSFGPVFLVSLISVFSTFGNITPGNIGIQEAVISISSGLMGIGSGIGLMVSLLIRIATLIPVFTLGPFFSYVLTRELTGRRVTGK